MKTRQILKFTTVCSTLIVFVLGTITPYLSFAETITLPNVGQMVHLSNQAFQPALLRGIQINPKNAMELDFIVTPGDERLRLQEFNDQTTRMVKYFLASLTIPDKDLWVNLSPYEKNRIVPPEFGKTEMGRDLLAEDYVLKQLTSTLVYPEDATGKKFWSKIYREVSQKTGSTNIPMNAFNKVWVVPKDVLIYENAKGAEIVSASMKVMLEEDLLAAGHLSKEQASATGTISPQVKQTLRQVIIPLIEKEVNQGRHFATLRQVYYSLALATWYKKRLKESILGQIYMNKDKVAGVTFNDAQNKEMIYQQYLKAFKKGVFNYIKEEPDAVTGQPIPRKYFAGGKDFSMIAKVERTTHDPQLAPSVANGVIARFLLNAAKAVKNAALPAVAAAGVVGAANPVQAQSPGEVGAIINNLQGRFIFPLGTNSPLFQITDKQKDVINFQASTNNLSNGNVVDQHTGKVLGIYEFTTLPQSAVYAQGLLTIFPNNNTNVVIMAGVHLLDGSNQMNPKVTEVLRVSRDVYDQNRPLLAGIIAQKPQVTVVGQDAEVLKNELRKLGQPGVGNFFAKLISSSETGSTVFNITGKVEELGSFSVDLNVVTALLKTSDNSDWTTRLVGNAYQEYTVVADTPVTYIPHISSYVDYVYQASSPNQFPSSKYVYGITTDTGYTMPVVVSEVGGSNSVNQISYLRSLFAEVLSGNSSRFEGLADIHVDGGFTQDQLGSALLTAMELLRNNPTLMYNQRTDINIYSMLMLTTTNNQSLFSSQTLDAYSLSMAYEISNFDLKMPGALSSLSNLYFALHTRNYTPGFSGVDLREIIEHRVRNELSSVEGTLDSRGIADGMYIWNSANQRAPNVKDANTLLGIISGWVPALSGQISQDEPDLTPEFQILSILEDLKNRYATNDYIFNTASAVYDELLFDLLTAEFPPTRPQSLQTKVSQTVRNKILDLAIKRTSAKIRQQTANGFDSIKLKDQAMLTQMKALLAVALNKAKKAALPTVAAAGTMLGAVNHSVSIPSTNLNPNTITLHPTNIKDVGGINFDPTQINMQVKFDGEGFRMDPTVLARFKDVRIDGLLPVMIGVLPFDNKEFLSGPVVK